MRNSFPPTSAAIASRPDLSRTSANRPSKPAASQLGFMSGRTAILPPHLAALRDRWRPDDRTGRPLAFGDRQVDDCLPGGGLRLGRLHEIEATGLDVETGALPAAFAATLVARIEPARPAFWIAPCPDLYGPGLLAYGLDPGRLVVIRPHDNAGALDVMETALRSGTAAAVVGEIGRLDRTASHRLQLACLRHGTTGLVLRRWPNGRKEAAPRPGTAATRWQITSTTSRICGRAPEPARWTVTLAYARGGRPGEWIMEASHDAPLGLRVVAALADHPTAQRHTG